MRYSKTSPSTTPSKLKDRYDKHTRITCATYAAARRRDLVEPEGLIDSSDNFSVRRGLWSCITRGYIHSRWMAQAASSPAIERARNVGLGNLRAKLNLTPAQEQEIMKILDDYGKFYQNIEDEREDVAEYGRRRILNALTPEQRARFNDMITPHARP